MACVAKQTVPTVTTPRLELMSELSGPVKIRCFAENFWTERVTVTLHRNVFKSATERGSDYGKKIRLLAKVRVRLMALARSECESSVISQKDRNAISLPTIFREGL